MTEDRISEWASDCASQIGHFLAFRRDTGEVSVKIGETIQKAVSEALAEQERVNGVLARYGERLEAALDEIESKVLWLDQNLTVPAAEYVPAIADSFPVLDELKAIIAKTREGAEK